MNSRNKNIKVVLADDYEITRAGWARMLSVDPSITIVGEASNGIEAIEVVAREKPDIVILDMIMPVMNGVIAAEEIKNLHPETKILMVVTYENSEYFESAFWICVDGYIAKEICTCDMLESVHLVAEGKKVFYRNIYDFMKTMFNGAEFMPEASSHRNLLKMPDKWDIGKKNLLINITERLKKINAGVLN